MEDRKNHEVSEFTEKIAKEIIHKIDKIKGYQEEYQKYKQKYPNDYNNNVNFNKMNGNSVAVTIRKNIDDLLKKDYRFKKFNYRVSECNSYIEGCPIEWDLIIIKDTAKKIDDTNIYEAKDCVCILEIKQSGMIGNSYFKDSIEKQIHNIEYLNTNNNSNLKFAYISFQETENYYDSTKKIFKENNIESNNVFIFVKYPYKKDKTLTFIDGCGDFKDYLFNILS